MHTLLWLPFAACGLIQEYRNNLILSVDDFDKKLDELNIKENTSVLLSSKMGWLIIGILILSVVITFFGIVFEKYSLSVFLGIFIYTAMQYFQELVDRFLTAVTPYLSESLKQYVSLDTAAIAFYLTAGVITFGIIVFILLYNLIKPVSMLIVTYLLFNWVVNSYFTLPETLDLIAKIAICVVVLAFYVLLHTVYLYVFAIAFASYGSLYTISFCCHMFAKTDNPFSEFLNAFYSANPINDLKAHRETLYWVAQTAIAFAIQITLIHV